MSGVQLRYTVTDDGPKAFFASMKSKFSSSETALLMELGAAALSSDVAKRFNEGVAPDGSPHIPSQRALAEGGTTLNDSGILQASVTYDANAHGFLLGTNEIYGAIHNEGGFAGRNNAVELPRRQWLGIAEPQEEILGRAWTGWLDA